MYIYYNICIIIICIYYIIYYIKYIIEYVYNYIYTQAEDIALAFLAVLLCFSPHIIPVPVIPSAPGDM